MGARLLPGPRDPGAWRSIASEVLPDGFSYEWTTLAFQALRAGDTAIFAFVLAVVFVFLVLAAQFESLTLPLAVILIVPMCLVASITGVVLRGQDNNILTQVGFVVLIGLAAKNAILIVEFARQLEDHGRDRWAAAVEAARLRLRPILMTSLAFIFGVVPLVWAVGAGAELRQNLGTAVFFGHDRRDAVRTDLHARLLRGQPLDRREDRAGAGRRRKRRRRRRNRTIRDATDQVRFRRAVRRKEDDALIRGAGRYVADHAPAGVLHAVVLRSPHAHARFRITDVAKAKAMPGVALVLTGADTASSATCPARERSPDTKVAVPPYPILARDEVKHVGDAVAFVVADTADRARDAAEAIAIEWDALPHVVGAAGGPGAGRTVGVARMMRGNLAFETELGDAEATARAFAAAARTVSLTLVNQRLVANYLDTRGVVAEYDPATTASR